MSQDYQDPELFADFIIEAKEHLETIEPNLLELEKAPDNLSLLNDIFRPMHSLKGASGFLGLNNINHLAHKAENILDELRKGAMIITSEIMDIILATTDALRQMIDNLESINSEGDVEYASLIEAIDAIMRGESVQSSPATAPEVELEPEVVEVVPEVAESAEKVVQQSSEEHKVHRKKATSMPPKEWIATLEILPVVTLTAFGEGHLKDFIDEAHENIENINTYLLALEKNPQASNEFINDLFRYFHNIKGNSGIIDFKELNSLTHEAETLLNKVRHGEQEITPDLVDLLLLVADVMDSLVNAIDPATGVANPFQTSELIVQVQKSIAGEEIALPTSILREIEEEVTEVAEQIESAQEGKTESSLAVTPIGQNRSDDEDDLSMFLSTINQQKALISHSLEALEKNGDLKDKVDALFRAITAIEKSASFMKFEDVKVYAGRTAGLVDQARKSDLDFGLMVDILKQEVAIIYEIIDKTVANYSPEAEKNEPAPAPVDKIPTKVLEESPKTQVPSASTATAPVAPKAATPSSADTSPKPTSPAPVAPKPTSSAPATPKPSAPAPTKAAAPSVAPAPKAATPAPVPAAESKSSSTIRVDHEKLDHLMNLIGELIINRNRYSMLARELEGSKEEINLADIAQNLSETTYSMARISDELQDTIMKVRMVPVSSVFSRFPRLVRDLSRKSNKEVDLILEGEETELDKSVVEVIGDPLVHLIRNSVDHGVESEEERIAKGKSPKGKVTLRAFHKGNSVAIEIEDDGKGIDPEKMREVAIRKGIITPEEAKNMDDKDAVELIFAPGFSSAEQITDISGRGVGMDVVRTNIKNLKGSVNTTTELGKGTKFTLSLPLTLAIIDALMVNVSGQTYAIPLDAVSETTKIEKVRLTDIKGKKAVTLRGEVLGVVEMSDLLNVPKTPNTSDLLSVVVIHDNDRRLGIVVDKLLERQEIVIKPLGAYLVDLKGISGATIMGDGSVILILDPHEIYSMATSKNTAPRE